MSEKIQVDRDVLEDIYMRVLSIPSLMTTSIDLIDGIPQTDKRKTEFQNKTLAIDINAVTRDYAKNTAEMINECLIKGGG